MNKYHPDRVHKRVDYAQYIYKMRDTYSAFESFIFPIVIYSRDGTIAAANKDFRYLTEIKEDDIQLKKVNIFDYLDDTNAGLIEAARNAFDGKENVYIYDRRLIHAEADSPEDYVSSKYPNAIFFPIARDEVGICLVGILLDKNTTDDTGDDT